jgi:hypothetical protein
LNGLPAGAWLRKGFAIEEVVAAASEVASAKLF